MTATTVSAEALTLAIEKFAYTTIMGAPTHTTGPSSWAVVWGGQQPQGVAWIVWLARPKRSVETNRLGNGGCGTYIEG